MLRELRAVWVCAPRGDRGQAVAPCGHTPNPRAVKLGAGLRRRRGEVERREDAVRIAQHGLLARLRHLKDAVDEWVAAQRANMARGDDVGVVAAEGAEAEGEGGRGGMVGAVLPD
jgi:hypothetical protein